MAVSVATLVEMFEHRPRPESGVVSRSRLRAWFLEAGGSEEQWPDLVRTLVARKLLFNAPGVIRAKAAQTSPAGRL